MKAVMPSALPDVLAFRKRTGTDRWDEMWEGVLHMPPAPTPEHQDLEWALETFFRTHWVRRHEGKVYHNVNFSAVGGWPDDFRIPDLVLLTPSSRAVRKDVHFEGAPDVVIEIKSPGDESLEKLPFYSALGVPEVWIVDRDTKVTTIHALEGGGYEAKTSEASRWILSERTKTELRCAESEGSGPSRKLSIRLQGDENESSDSRCPV
jgi:Uma2 family endonuclease